MYDIISQVKPTSERSKIFHAPQRCLKYSEGQNSRIKSLLMQSAFFARLCEFAIVAFPL